MRKMIVFDMDGTIADLYGVENWLPMLRAEDDTPYRVAEPLFDMDLLIELLEIIKDMGWTIAVTSWLAMNGSKKYNNKVREAKKNWLKQYNFPLDEIHLVKYGTTKADCTRKKADYQILVDDNEEIRKGWTLGKAIQPEKLITTLIDIIIKENIEKMDKMRGA